MNFALFECIFVLFLHGHRKVYFVPGKENLVLASLDGRTPLFYIRRHITVGSRIVLNLVGQLFTPFESIVMITHFCVFINSI